jgi:hypothetical protein
VKLLTYFEKIASCDNFAFLLRLIEDTQKVDILSYVTNCVNVVCNNEVNTTEEVRVRATQVLEKYKK